MTLSEKKKDGAVVSSEIAEMSKSPAKINHPMNISKRYFSPWSFSLTIYE